MHAPRRLHRTVPALVASLLAFLLLAVQAPATPAAAAPPTDEHAVVLSLQGLDCASCYDEIAAELDRVHGVRSSKFDRRTVETTVFVAAGVPTDSLLAAVTRAGFTAQVGAGHGRWLPLEGFGEGADAVIAVKAGEDLADLASILVPGKITVVDFYADWCGPCRQVDRHMKDVLASRTDVALRKVNIVDWDTPIAKRHLKGASGIPYLVVFDGTGRKVGSIQGLRLDKLDAAIAKAAKR